MPLCRSRIHGSRSPLEHDRRLGFQSGQRISRLHHRAENVIDGIAFLASITGCSRYFARLPFAWHRETPNPIAARFAANYAESEVEDSRSESETIGHSAETCQDLFGNRLVL